jgi:hypothetical protein
VPPGLAGAQAVRNRSTTEESMPSFASMGASTHVAAC